jgi:hypothetical protein
MSEDGSVGGHGTVRLPSSGHEFWALIIAVGVVFVLVQIGAPIIRTFDFLDPKLREYFIGMSFAAFPVVHRGSKQYLSRYSRLAEPELQDSAPWYVAGVIAAAVLFGWNQFVSFFAAMALGVALQAYPDPSTLQLNMETLGQMQTFALLIIVMPMCAVASIYAGILVNRHTRSHTLAALGLAAAVFVVINTLFTWLMNPEYMDAIFALIAMGGTQAVQVAVGMSLAGLNVFVFGVLGVYVSRYNRERPLGKIVEAARRLTTEQREALALEIATRARAAAASAAPPAPPSPPPPVQFPTGAEP